MAKISDLMGLGMPAALAQLLGEESPGGQTFTTLLGNAATNFIGVNTVDGSDNRQLVLGGGGASGAGRGAELTLNGNDVGGGGGYVQLTSSSAAGSLITIKCNSSTGFINFENNAGIIARFVSSSSDLELDGTIGGNLVINRLGRGIKIKTGTNSRAGSAVLVGGTVTVANTSVLTATTKILYNRTTTGGTPGHLSATMINATSFTITSSSGTDTSTVDWQLFDLVP